VIKKCVSPLPGSELTLRPQATDEPSAHSAAATENLLNVTVRPFLIVFLHRTLPIVSHHSQLPLCCRLRPVVLIQLRS
jgi:hypothetical protein